MTDHVPDTYPRVPATEPLALKSNLVLGPNVPERGELDQSLQTYFRERNSARDALHRRQRRAEQLQGGMTNDELLAAWKQKLPGIEPTDRELTSFALGVEVGCGRVA